VADVEHDAARLAASAAGQQLAVLHDVGALRRRRSGAPEVAVRRGCRPARSVSRICDISSRVCTPPMWHITLRRDAGLLARRDRALQRLEAVCAITFSLMRTLHAEHEVGVLGHRAARRRRPARSRC
jgi:hypothetical protein